MEKYRHGTQGDTGYRIEEFRHGLGHKLDTEDPHSHKQVKWSIKGIVWSEFRCGIELQINEE